jgi:cytochrome c
MRNAFIASAVMAAAGLFASSTANAADAKRGDKLFDECRTCHSVEAGANGVGPSLKGVIGRKAGTLDDFRYSPQLKRSDITWNAKTLDAFIADPQQVVPANRMPYSGMPDAKNRADLIEYLLQVAK